MCVEIRDNFAEVSLSILGCQDVVQDGRLALQALVLPAFSQQPRVSWAVPLFLFSFRPLLCFVPCTNPVNSHIRHLPVPGGVLELHSTAAEVAGCLSPLYIADRGAAVRLLSPRGHLPLQLFPLWLHLLCGQLHLSGLLENTDQPPEQGGFPRHLS